MAGNNLNLVVGVLAFQGDVREHSEVLESLGVSVLKVRKPEELAQVSGLIIPGGESSVMDKLVRQFGMQQPLKDAIAAGLPVFGTCAGLIMLADDIVDAIDEQESLGGLHVAVQRNAFGTQVDSFETNLHIPQVSTEPIPATFIRAPIVVSATEEVTILSQLPDGRIVAVEQGNLLGISFHPEVNGDTRFHEYFLTRVRHWASQKKATI